MKEIVWNSPSNPFILFIIHLFAFAFAFAFAIGFHNSHQQSKIKESMRCHDKYFQWMVSSSSFWTSSSFVNSTNILLPKYSQQSTCKYKHKNSKCINIKANKDTRFCECYFIVIYFAIYYYYYSITICCRPKFIKWIWDGEFVTFGEI